MALSLRSRCVYGMSFDPSQVGGGDPPMFDGLVNAAGSGFISDLSTYKAQSARVVIKVVGGPSQYQNADLSFNLVMWKSEVDTAAARTNAQQMGNFVLDGTVAGVLLIDDAKEGSAIFGGVPPTTEQLDEMAPVSYTHLTLPTILLV